MKDVIVNKEPQLNQLSSHLFWEYDASTLEWEEDSLLIIHRVLEYGLLNDWLVVYRYYGLETIVENAKSFRTLDPIAHSFIATISKTPLNAFRCYTTKLLNPTLWNS